MPHGWTIVGTPDELAEVMNNPHEFGRRVEMRVRNAGAVVGHILWETERRAHVVTHVPREGAEEIFGRLDESLGTTARLYDEFEEIDRREELGG
jgi:hypothetical protein